MSLMKFNEQLFLLLNRSRKAKSSLDNYMSIQWQFWQTIIHDGFHDSTQSTPLSLQWVWGWTAATRANRWWYDNWIWAREVQADGKAKWKRRCLRVITQLTTIRCCKHDFPCICSTVKHRWIRDRYILSTWCLTSPQGQTAQRVFCMWQKACWSYADLTKEVWWLIIFCLWG